MTTEGVEVAIPELENLCRAALETLGYRDHELDTITEVFRCCAAPHWKVVLTDKRRNDTLQVLLYAQLRNNSNNMVKVITGGLDKLTDEFAPEVQQQSSISAVIDGHHSAGIVVMKEALQLAVTKAKSHGCAVIGTNHTATGSGAIGYVITLKLDCCTGL